MPTKKQQKFQKKLMLTGVAVREQLMSYFKDVDIPGTVRVRDGIIWNNANDRTTYLYERRYRDMERRKHLYIGMVRFAEAGRNPNVFHFLPDASRSPQLRQLRDEAENVIKRYLPTVEVITDPYVGDELDDTEMIDNSIQVEVRTGMSPYNTNYTIYADEYSETVETELSDPRPYRPSPSTVRPHFVNLTNSHPFTITPEDLQAMQNQAMNPFRGDNSSETISDDEANRPF